MEPSTPFFDGEPGTLDVQQIVDEAVPVGKLIGLFVAVALVPMLFAVLVGGVFGGLLMLIAQFIIGIGSALTLMYVIVRALQLADRGAPRADTGQRTATGTSTVGGSHGEDDEGAGADEAVDGDDDDVAGDDADEDVEEGDDGDDADEDVEEGDASDDGADEGDAGDVGEGSTEDDDGE